MLIIVLTLDVRGGLIWQQRDGDFSIKPSLWFKFIKVKMHSFSNVYNQKAKKERKKKMKKQRKKGELWS